MPSNSGNEKTGKNLGDFHKKYRDGYLYRVNPWSKSYVRHLHYLEILITLKKHPDEDWAETFAIWLDPRSHWGVNIEIGPPPLKNYPMWIV